MRKKLVGRTLLATFATLYTGLAFDGTLSGSGEATARLTKAADGTWGTETLYMLPGNGEQLTLTIALSDADGTEKFTHTRKGTFEAGKPYLLTGSYKGEVLVNSSVNGAEWGTSEEIGFGFGPGEADSGEEEETGSGNGTADSPIAVTAIPSEKSVWEGHFVASVAKASDQEATLLLMSLKEWETTPENAATASDGYSEGTLGGWRIPTGEEMGSIAITVGHTNKIGTSNSLIAEAGGDGLKSSGEYLCEEAAKYVIMSSDVAALTATGGRTYRLRLVKSVSVAAE